MKIISINCHVLLIPMVREDATDSAQDNLVVFIETDTGLIGVGESDANPWILKATIEASTLLSRLILLDIVKCFLNFYYLPRT